MVEIELGLVLAEEDVFYIFFVGKGGILDLYSYNYMGGDIGKGGGRGDLEVFVQLKGQMCEIEWW